MATTRVQEVDAMTKLSRMLALLLLVAAVALIILAFNLGRRTEPRVAATGEAPRPAPAAQAAAGPLDVVVAAHALARDRPLKPGDLLRSKASLAPPGSFTRADTLVGRLPVRAIAAGEVITLDLLVHGLATQLEPGQRAVAVPVAETAAAGNRIHPGDYVDVFFSMTDQDSGTRRDTQSRLLLARLRVLAFGTEDLPLPAAPASTAPPVRPARRTETPARSAVLAVPVDAVNRLLLAAQQGKLSLALRNPGDAGVPDPELFPQPPPTLAPLAAQRAALERPENRAYAGIDTEGLATPPAPHPSRGQASSSVPIVRGTRLERLRYLRQPASEAGDRP
jgi:pilus assembly protein CpaB